MGASARANPNSVSGRAAGVMTGLLLTTGVVVLIGCYLRVKPKGALVGPFLPDSFLFGIGLYATGAVVVGLAEGMPRITELIVISLMTLMSALVGAIIFSLFCSKFYRNVRFISQFSRIDSGPLERLSVKILLGLSGIVCVAFIYAVFSSSVVGALLSIVSIVSDSTFLEARKAITSGTDGYFAPGYIKQFRDIIIPVALIGTMGMSTKFRRSPLVWFAFMSAVLAMVVSGQRLVFVVFFLSLLLGSYYTSRFPARNQGATKRKSGIPWATIGALFGVYALLTVLLGRASEGLSVVGIVLEVVVNLLDRVFLAAPRENALTLPLWYAMGPTWGQSWLADLAGILPGVGESFSNILHSETGGSLQGNSPLGLPADVWYAWGWVGVLIVPFLYAFAIGIVDMVLLSNRSGIFFGLRLYLFVVLPICYSPFLFVLYGGAVVFVLILFVFGLRSRRIRHANSVLEPT